MALVKQLTADIPCFRPPSHHPVLPVRMKDRHFPSSIPQTGLKKNPTKNCSLHNPEEEESWTHVVMLQSGAFSHGLQSRLDEGAHNLVPVEGCCAVVVEAAPHHYLSVSTAFDFRTTSRMTRSPTLRQTRVLLSLKATVKRDSSVKRILDNCCLVQCRWHRHHTAERDNVAESTDF